MTGRQISVYLREQAEPHHVLHHILAADEAAAAPFIAAWQALGSTRAGRTEVTVRPLHHPDREPQTSPTLIAPPVLPVRRPESWPSPPYSEPEEVAWTSG